MLCFIWCTLSFQFIIVYKSFVGDCKMICFSSEEKGTWPPLVSQGESRWELRPLLMSHILVLIQSYDVKDVIRLWKTEKIGGFCESFGGSVLLRLYSGAPIGNLPRQWSVCILSNLELYSFSSNSLHKDIGNYTQDRLRAAVNAFAVCFHFLFSL